MPAGDVMEPRPEFNPTVGSFPFTEQDWDQTPPAVQAYVSTLHDEVAQWCFCDTRMQENLHDFKSLDHRNLEPIP
jgi:hypothetical protein